VKERRRLEALPYIQQNPCWIGIMSNIQDNLV
jgi:hypothetical protein